jgi:hypothetical protein
MVFSPTITDSMNCVAAPQAGSMKSLHNTLKYVTKAKYAANAHVMKIYRSGQGPSGMIPKTIHTRTERMRREWRR